MNLFSKTLLVGLAPCAAYAQGLYSIAPNDDEATDSLPLSYTVGAAVGYDDNPNPLVGAGDEAFYASAFVQANWTSVTPQTTWDVFARLGVRHYFDDFVRIPGVEDGEATRGDARLGVNWTHRVSERLRLSSRNLVAYETEPDYSFGIGTSARAGNYIRYSSQNSVGYRWSDRLGTQSGIDLSGIRFDELENSDYNQIAFRHQFRYRMSPATVLTAEYRYSVTQADGIADTNSHYLLGGVEHRISPVSAIVLRAGVQITEPDGGESFTSPFLEGALRSQLTEQFGINAFVRYSSEDWNRTLQTVGGPFFFGESQTLRFGLRGNYAVNPTLSLFGGINYIMTDFSEGFVTNPTAGDGSEDILNLNVGASYQFADNLYLTGSYNFTNASSDFAGRDYDRNRFELGVQATF